MSGNSQLFFTNVNIMIENDDSLVAVGKRLSILRTMAGWSRDGLSTAARVSAQSISYWENANGGVISAKSMEKIISAFRTKGIICSEDWIRKGAGDLPIQQSKSLRKALIQTSSDTGDTQINQETALFLALEKEKGQREIIITKIENTSMTPVFERGDIVGGIFIPAHSVDLTKEQMCIIKFENKIDVRRVKKGTLPSTYHLSYFSYDPNNELPLEMNNVHLEVLAPIIRVWR